MLEWYISSLCERERIQMKWNWNAGGGAYDIEYQVTGEIAEPNEENGVDYSCLVCWKEIPNHQRT